MTKVRLDSRPLYILVKEKIDELICNGTFSLGSRLPSENALADDLGVSRATLREALRALEEEGKIIRQQGIGTFIAPRLSKMQKGIEDLFSVTETIESQGFKPGTEGYTIWQEKMGELSCVFEEKPDDLMWVIERIRTANREPVVYCKDYLSQKLVPTKLDLTKNPYGESIFEVLEKQYHLRITHAIARIIPLTAPDWLATNLKIVSETPLLLLEQRIYDQKEQLIIFSRNYFRHDKIEFQVLRKRR